MEEGAVAAEAEGRHVLAGQAARVAGGARQRAPQGYLAALALHAGRGVGCREVVAPGIVAGLAGGRGVDGGTVGAGGVAEVALEDGEGPRVVVEVVGRAAGAAGPAAQVLLRAVVEPAGGAVQGGPATAGEAAGCAEGTGLGADVPVEAVGAGADAGVVVEEEGAVAAEAEGRHVLAGQAARVAGGARQRAPNNDIIRLASSTGGGRGAEEIVTRTLVAN